MLAAQGDKHEVAGSGTSEARHAVVNTPPQARPSLRTRVQEVLRVVRTIIGVPDYDRYVQHVCAHHPGATPLSRQEFERDRMTAKYTRPGSRCC